MKSALLIILLLGVTLVPWCSAQEKGEKGEMGIPGVRGDRGEPGQPGPPGAQGDRGILGEPGLPGPQGTQGVKGESGESGQNGAPGARGDMGVPGNRGLIGVPGATGDRGEPGKPGPLGHLGYTGQKGEPGEGIRVGLQSGLFGRFGPPGPSGPQGPHGPQGAHGNTGHPGEAGVPGRPGVDGVNGSAANVGEVYTRWGGIACPVGAETVYGGRMGSSVHNETGGASNYICLPDNTEYREQGSGMKGEQNGFVAATEYDNGMDSDIVPCAVCFIPRSTVLIIPARTTCPTNWSIEYDGYLMSQSSTQTRTEFVCVDIPTGVPSTRTMEGAQLHHTQAICDSGLNCESYLDGRELACVVCSR